MISGINYPAKMLTKKIKSSSNRVFSVKTTKYEMQKPPTFCATLFGCKFWFDVSHFYQLFYLFQLVAQQKCLFQVKESLVGRWSSLSNRFWLRCWFFIELPTCLGSGHTNQINQSARYISSTCNNFFVAWLCPTS